MSARRRAVLPALILVPLLLTACGGGHEHHHGASERAAAESGSAAYNDTDVMFLQMLIEHHGQGLAMSRVAAERAERAEVRRLAAAVAATQAEEVKTMTGWLNAWSQPTAGEHGGHGDHGPHAAHGALPATGPKEIETLKKTRGDGFEAAFLNLFIGHQHGAVHLADMELSKGSNADAKAFAKRVKESRTDQIQQMLGLVDA